MARRKKKDEYNQSRETTEDLEKLKSTKQIKLPKIEQQPDEAVCLQRRKQRDRSHQQEAAKDHKKEELHLPEIYDGKRSSSFLAYNQQPYSYHQATMEFAAKKFMRRKVADEYRERMANIEYEDDFERLNQLQKALENNCGEYNCLYTREASMSITERERELDQKRQAMLDMKDKQVKFFRKCKHEHLNARASFQTDGQSKQKKDIQEKRAQQNEAAPLMEVRANESRRSSFLHDYHAETVYPVLYDNKPVDYVKDTRPRHLPTEANILENRLHARKELKPEWKNQGNRQHQVPLPPINPRSITGHSQLPTCEKSEKRQHTKPDTGIHSNVLADEKLRNETRLNLSHAQTPVAGQKIRQSMKQLKDEENRQKSNKNARDNL